MDSFQNQSTAYIIGVAIGDGNLSNPNGRAVRLRVTCDNKYPQIIETILAEIKNILPKNKVSLVPRKGCTDISCYSNSWTKILGWKPGAKSSQKIKIPTWVLSDRNYTISCLRGLFQTDGSIYKDRKYTMVNFTTTLPTISNQVFQIISEMGYSPQIRKVVHDDKVKYVIRISKNVASFIAEIDLWKK